MEISRVWDCVCELVQEENMSVGTLGSAQVSSRTTLNSLLLEHNNFHFVLGKQIISNVNFLLF